MAPRGPAKRGICSLCGRDVAARADGTPRAHQTPSGVVCPALAFAFAPRSARERDHASIDEPNVVPLDDPNVPESLVPIPPSAPLTDLRRVARVADSMATKRTNDRARFALDGRGN